MAEEQLVFPFVVEGFNEPDEHHPDDQTGWEFVVFELEDEE